MTNQNQIEFRLGISLCDTSKVTYKQQIIDFFFQKEIKSEFCS